MAIRYALHRNETIAGRNRCVARVYSSGTIEYEEYIALLCDRGSTTTKADALAVHEDGFSVILQLLLEGYNVRTRWAVYSVEIRGTFESEMDHFDPKRHEIWIRIRATSDFNRSLQLAAHPVRIEAKELSPNPRMLEDVASGERNCLLTAGGMAKLSGYRLDYDEQDVEQGVFLIGEDRSVTRVKMADRRAGQIIFLVPYLPVGAYRLAVRAMASGGNKILTGFLDHVLSLVAGQSQLGEPSAIKGLLPPG